MLSRYADFQVPRYLGSLFFVFPASDLSAKTGLENEAPLPKSRPRSFSRIVPINSPRWSRLSKNTRFHNPIQRRSRSTSSGQCSIKSPSRDWKSTKTTRSKWSRPPGSARDSRAGRSTAGPRRTVSISTTRFLHILFPSLFPPSKFMTVAFKIMILERSAE